MSAASGGVRFDVYDSNDHGSESLFPTRVNDLELMQRRRPGGQVVGPGAADFNMQEIDYMLSMGSSRRNDEGSNEYWFDDEY